MGLFDKKNTADEKPRLLEISSQSFGTVDTRIVMDTTTGANYIIATNNALGGVSVTPLLDDTGEPMITDIDEFFGEDEEDEDEDDDDEGGSSLNIMGKVFKI